MVKYGSDHRLTFNFDNKTWAGYWFLRSVHYDFLQKGTSNNITSVILKTSSDIVAPLAKSYHSGSTVTFFNRSMTSSLTFSDLQVSFFSYLILVYTFISLAVSSTPQNSNHCRTKYMRDPEAKTDIYIIVSFSGRPKNDQKCILYGILTFFLLQKDCIEIHFLK